MFLKVRVHSVSNGSSCAQSCGSFEALEEHYIIQSRYLLYQALRNPLSSVRRIPVQLIF